MISLAHKFQFSYQGVQPPKSSTSKGSKGVKKNAGKGRKKTTQKTEPAAAVEANGPLEKNKVTAE